MTLNNTFRYEIASARRRRAARRRSIMPEPVLHPSDRRLADLFLLEELSSLRAPVGTPRTEATDLPCARVGPPDLDALVAVLLAHVEKVHRRLDTLDRNSADLMFLQMSVQTMLYGERRDFSERSQNIILRVVAGEPYKGRCPSCMDERVLADRGRPAPGAQFDHAFHRSLNRPEYGWLVCRDCHNELTHDGYLARYQRLAAFRKFQEAVVTQRRRARMRPGSAEA